MTNEHTPLEKYTSHTLFSKGLRKGWYWLSVRGELDTEQTATYWPQVPLTIVALILLGCSTGVLRAQTLCLELVLTASNSNSNSNYNWLQLTQTVCGIWLYNCLLPLMLPVGVCIEFNHVHRSRWYPDIFDRMHLLFTQVHLLIDSSVEGQYVTGSKTRGHKINQFLLLSMLQLLKPVPKTGRRERIFSNR